MPNLNKLDRYVLWTVCAAIITVVAINFITSYGHIYAEGIKYGEYGVDARLMPIGIDGMLLALGMANVFAARFDRGHWLLRSALGFGVAGTVAANGAYGAGWGLTGGLLATWSPVALFIAVEAGLYMFRVAVEVATPRKRQYTPRAPREPRTQAPYAGGSDLAVPVIRGRVDVLNPFEDLRESSQAV